MGLLNQTQQNYYNGNNHGNYQFTSLNDVITQFIVAYVGEDKIISKVKRADVAFHAQRAMQELSFDTFKSCKSQEITVPATLQMTLPQDYVNYTKISYVDSSGIKHPIYPTNRTSNPSSNPLQDSDGDFILQATGALDENTSTIVLDTEYKDIIKGMSISGTYIPTGAIVSSVSTTSSVTTIKISLANGTATTPSFTNTGTTLNFSNADGSLILPQKSSFIVENLDWNHDLLADYKISANAAADIADIEIGMKVFHEDFPVGTVVTNVSGTTIVVSNLATAVMAANAGNVLFVSPGKIDTDTWRNYKSIAPSENNNDDYEDDTYWPMQGGRYGLDPQHAQVNGSFYIDCVSGKIHFSSNISGKTVILDYISDSLGTDEEMQVHKFAEEAMYKWIAYAILSTRANTQEYIVQRFKKERFAETRKAKLRLSNIKLEEITQILRGKSKQIKH